MNCDVTGMNTRNNTLYVYIIITSPIRKESDVLHNTTESLTCNSHKTMSYNRKPQALAQNVLVQKKASQVFAQNGLVQKKSHKH